MIDSITRKPLTINSYQGKGGILDLPLEQLDKVRALLDANIIFYWVDDEVLSINGGPETAWITISQKHDAAMVQRLLDSIP
jgi:hypothetical protein